MQQSFYQSVDSRDREAIFGDYVGFLGRRNGEMDFSRRRYSKREAHLEALAAGKVLTTAPSTPICFAASTPATTGRSTPRRRCSSC